MSNASPILNGENTGGVSDFATDASINMVAAIHDHISCAKPVQMDPFNSQDTKAGIITYSCDFDHMYASLTDSATLQKDTAEVKHLKELLLLHLDLIQQQSEQLVTKDKQLSALRQENETLRQRLERMDRRVTLQKHREGPEPTLPPPPVCAVSPNPSPTFPGGPVIVNSLSPVVETETDTITIPLENMDTNSHSTLTVVSNENMDCQNMVTNTWEASKRRRREPDSVSASSVGAGIGVGRRRRLSSWTSSVNSDVTSHDGRTSLGSTPEGRGRGQKRLRSKGVPVKKDNMVTTDVLYYTPVGDADTVWTVPGPSTVREPEVNGHVEACVGYVQVPSWRQKIYTSCYTMEGTENLDDEVFNKRHQRLEINERRRKRWDVQRIREQRQIEKLKQREMAATRKTSRHHDEEPLATLWPHIDDAEYVEVQEDVPVTAFGVNLSKWAESEFSLPWLLSARCKTPSHTTTRRRYERRR